MEKELIYLGNFSGEEMYINLKDKKLTGWSLMGLRPETEDNLRRYARDTEISEFYNVDDIPHHYLNHENFAEDMENGWLESHDSQGEYEKEGETYYLGFGLGTDIFHFFKEHKIKSFDDLNKLFDDLNITEEQFKELQKVMIIYKKDEVKGYNLFLELSKGISQFPEGCS